MTDAIDTTESTVSPFDQVKATSGLLERYFREVLDRNGENSLRISGDHFQCRCPFHEERSPSCHVHPDHYHCFGCGKHGTVIDAVMENEDIEFPFDALKSLNERFQLHLTLTGWKHSEHMQKTRDMITEGEREWNDPKSSSAAAARQIISDRGISDETRQFFGLTVNKKEGRILIPIRERGGHPVGWSGRAMKEDMPCRHCGQIVEARDAWHLRKDALEDARDKGSDTSEAWTIARKAGCVCQHCGREDGVMAFLADQFPKYKDSTGYRKKENLYNLWAASQALYAQRNADRRQPMLLMMEGFADVWSCHEIGFPGATAWNGNELTAIQAKQAVDAARRYGRWIGIIYDNDHNKTGDIKLHKAIAQLREIDPTVDVRVLTGLNTLTYDQDGDAVECKDANDVLRHLGRDVLSNLVWKIKGDSDSGWISADEWRIRYVLDSGFDRTQEIDQVAEILSHVRNTISLNNIAPMLAEHWGSDQQWVEKFIHDGAAHKGTVSDSDRITANIDQMEQAARDFLADEFAISTDYDELNGILPGGGFRPGQYITVIGKSGTAKTTFFCNLIWQFIRRQRIRVMFVSLEQPKAQIFISLAQIMLGKEQDDVERMIKESDPGLEPLREFFRDYLVFVDNVPTGSATTQDMTPGRINKLIYEQNLIGGDTPVQVVMVDHLGLMAADENAPREVQGDENKTPGWCTTQFMQMAKTTGTCIFALSQTSKQREAGEAIEGSDARGSSKIQDNSDLILGLSRPEQRPGISEEERIAHRGVLQIWVPKNRHGPSGMCIPLFFATKTRRIVEENPFGIPQGYLPDIAGGEVESPGELFADSDLTASVDDVPSWFLSGAGDVA